MAVLAACDGCLEWPRWMLSTAAFNGRTDTQGWGPDIRTGMERQHRRRSGSARIDGFVVRLICV